MNDFKQFFINLDIKNIKFELITTCNPKGNEQLTKPFQIKNFGLTIKEHTKKWSDIHLINSLHSKIYLFYKNDSIILGIVKSANFTNNGLSHNHETGVVFEDNKILNDLEVDIRNNLDYINLSESQVDDLCREADLIKKDKLSKKEEDIDINISKYLEKYNIQSLEESPNLNNSDMIIDKTKRFDFEKFIDKLITKNNKVETIDASSLDINIIPININKLAELKNINMSNNNITVLPDELFLVNKLERLDISNNDIKSIPDSIRNLARTYPKVFHKLVIYGNEDIKIDIDITWIKSFKTIIVDKLIVNKTLLIFNIFKDANVQIVDNHNNDLYEYIEYCNNEVLNDETNTLEDEYNKNIIKTCTICEKELELDKFYNSEKHSGKNHYYPYCKDCNSKDNIDKEKQPDYIIRRMYNQKIMPRADKNNTSIPYTKEEFVELLEEQPLFKELYEEYEKSEYITERKPSFYLMNKQTDFSLENIQICTSKEANEKHRQSLMNYGGKTTIQFTLSEEVLQIYESTQDARRAMGLKPKDDRIMTCCNKKSNTAVDYKWEYLKNINDTTILQKIDRIKKVNQCYVDDEDFLLELVDNKDLEDYLKVILYFKNYEDQELQEVIQEALLSNTNGYLFELFKKDTFELIEEFNNNYSKIETEHFNYLYGFVNIRYTENENIPILEILKIIAKNTTKKQLIEFLMENKTKQEIFIAIIKNKKIKNDAYFIDLNFLENRIIKYHLNSNYIELANTILQNEELSTSIIKKIIVKTSEEQIKNTLLSITYLKSSTNKWIINNFIQDEKK